MAETPAAFVILSLVAATAALAAYFVWPRTPKALLAFDEAPDRPVGFGADMSWLALRTTNTARVVEALGLRSGRACNWQSGVGGVYDPKFKDTLVFVSPPIDGWTLVVGRGLPAPLDSRHLVDHQTPFLLRLSRIFGECQYFCEFEAVDLTAWIKCASGAVERGYAASGDGPFLEIGKPTGVEKRFGLKNFELVGLEQRKGDVGGRLLMVPNPDQVFAIAAAWSLDPRKLGKLTQQEMGTGWIAAAPRAWKPVFHAEPLQRVA